MTTTRTISGTKRTEHRYAEVVGQMRPVNERANEGDRYPVTLADLEGFLAAARAQGVPLDTPVKTPGIFGSNQRISRIVVEATVETDAEGNEL